MAKIAAFVVALSALVGASAQAADSYAIDQVMGRADAPITIIEYASTTCGHCATFNREVMPRIKAEWIETGKARLIYRDLPTRPADISVGASMIAHCAGPDRYFGVLGMIFDAQDRWMNDNPLASLKKLVRLAGMTSEDVDACLARSDLGTAIQSRAQDGVKQFNLESTPTLVINGKTHAGAKSYDAYDKILKDAK